MILKNRVIALGLLLYLYRPVVVLGSLLGSDHYPLVGTLAVEGLHKFQKPFLQTPLLVGSRVPLLAVKGSVALARS